MENWKYTNIVTTKIKKPGGFIDMAIKVGDEKTQVYSYPKGQDVREKIKNDLSLEGWVFGGESTNDGVTTIIFKRPLED